MQKIFAKKEKSLLRKIKHRLKKEEVAENIPRKNLCKKNKASL
jgi:hypothetical protein